MIDDLITAPTDWPANAGPPVPAETCERVIAGWQDDIPVTAAQAFDVAERLLRGNWPWLAKTDQDLGAYLRNLATVIESGSRQASIHVLDPVNGPAWDGDRPPTPQALHREITAFSLRRKGALVQAKRVLAEIDRRKAAAALDRKIEQDRAAVLERSNGDPFGTILQGLKT